MNPLRRLAAALRRAIAGNLRARHQRRRLDRYRALFSRNNLLRDTADPQYPARVRAFWEEHYGQAVNPLWHVACANVTGNEDVRFVPNDTWFDEILPFFNKMSMHPAYSDKNLSDLLLQGINAPATVVRRMHGVYYSGNYEPISRPAALAAILGGSTEQIIKPSLTDNGIGITKLEIVGGAITRDGHAIDLEALEQSHGTDFVVQPRLQQHPTMSAPHPSSLNTIRLVTFRWNGEVRVLMSFARFGTAGSITDNLGTGGVCCGIDEGGQMSPTAVDEYGAVLVHHPTTGYAFGQRATVPNYQEMCQQALALHRKIWHFDIVSWDIAVGEHGEPVFIEFNVRGTSYLYQFASGKPLFGELTEAVLQRMRDSRNGSLVPQRS